MSWLKKFFSILALLAWTAFSVFASQFVFGFLFVLIFNDFTTSTVLSALYSAISYAFSLFLIIFIPWKIFKKWKTSREELGLKSLPTFVDIGLAPVGFVVYYLLASLLTSIFQLFPWFDMTETQNVGFNYLFSIGDRLLAFIALAIIAPIAEELIFRGWLYGKLRTKLPNKLSLFLSIFLVSLLFAILHGQWNVGVNVFAMSIVLCFMREITGTIYSGIFLHILKNTLAFFLVYIFNIS